MEKVAVNQLKGKACFCCSEGIKRTIETEGFTKGHDVRKLIITKSE